MAVKKGRQIKFRVAVICSILWLLFVLSQIIPANPGDFANMLAEIIILGIAPLVILWGIWWIDKAKKKKSRYLRFSG
jgi:hypothetical protein